MVGKFDFDRFDHFVVQMNVVQSHAIYIIKMSIKTTLLKIVTPYIPSDF